MIDQPMRKMFKFFYYCSSLLPQYIILLLLFIMENASKKGNANYIFISGKTTFHIILIIFIFSIISLAIIDINLNNVQSTCSDSEKPTGDPFKSYISNKVNSDSIGFIFNLLIPVISLFSSYNSIDTSLFVIIFLQIFIYLFYLRSSDIFPNLSLGLIRYNVYKIDKTKPHNICSEYIFGKCKHGTHYCGHKVTIIPFIPNHEDSRFAVIKESGD